MKEIAERTRLIKTMEVKGKKKTPFFVRMVISPGSFPKEKEGM